MFQPPRLESGFAACAADLDIPSPLPLRGEERARVMRLRARTVQELCEWAHVRCRVSGGISPDVVFWDAPDHGHTVDENGAPRYAVSTRGLPQRKQQRALRVLEILAYGFQDYIARESVCGRGFFVFPVTPESGRVWLAEIGRRGGSSRSGAKAITSAANGRKRVRAG